MYNVAVVHEALQRRGEPWKWGVQQLAMESWQQPTKRVTTANPLTTAKEVAEKLSINHSMVIWHLKQTRKVKKFNKWVPHELTRNNNNIIIIIIIINHCFEVSSSLILHNC